MVDPGEHKGRIPSAVPDFENVQCIRIMLCTGYMEHCFAFSFFRARKTILGLR